MTRTKLPLLLAMTILAVSTSQLMAETNYDESKVPKYTLPDPLVCLDGSKVTDADTWRNKRRPEILKLFEEHVYGKAPAEAIAPKVTVRTSPSPSRLKYKEVTLLFRRAGKEVSLQLLILLPPEAKQPVPVLVGLNFYGNHTIDPEPTITLSKQWMRDNKSKGIVNHRATEKSRGASSSRWPVDDILKRGYGLVTLYCGDIDPDVRDGFKNGVHPLFDPQDQTKRAANQWGTIAAWAWGLSRVMDYLETEPGINAQQVVLMGHSRLGKTALLAGARDKRFAVVISNNSGCGGASLSRRKFGETVAVINSSFPHWFCGRFKNYNSKEAKLPVDQHMLIALVAPRPVLICSAQQDRWADPRGEFLAALGAAPVYKLLGTDGIEQDTMPELNHRMKSTIGYHIRPGRHNVLRSDWQVYMDFADHHFGRPKNSSKD